MKEPALGFLPRLGAAGTRRVWFHRCIARLAATRTLEIDRPEWAERSVQYLIRHHLWQPPA